MRILITGNSGYVGPVLVRHLRGIMPKAKIIGYDAGFFAHCLTNVEALPETRLDRQYYGDVRDLPPELLEDTDTVVHLAAVSNDPMGNRFEGVTDEVNAVASIRLARLAQAAGVRAFVFASSCSIYGSAEGGPRRESDEVDPLTAYARSKVATERELSGFNAGGMTITCLRFATACGMSERLRLDLVLNDFVASAIATGEIDVLSDGSPWRPLVDVRDMARAIEWAIDRPPSVGGEILSVNVGTDAWNYQVKDLAEAVAAAMPGTRVSINRQAPPDKRSYRVDFALFRRLAPHHQPVCTLNDTIIGLKHGLENMAFADRDFRNSSLIRLKTVDRLISQGLLSPSLRWCRGPFGGTAT
jgi:nucleoside-diphosphate-sugar epimerase